MSAALEVLESRTLLSLPAPTLDAPVGTVTAEFPQFSWSTVSGADHYDLWVNDRTTGENGILRETNVVGTTFSPREGLLEGHEFQWTVRAVDARDFPGEWATPAIFTRAADDLPAPLAPAGMSSAPAPTFLWLGSTDGNGEIQPVPSGPSQGRPLGALVSPQSAVPGGPGLPNGNRFAQWNVRAVGFPGNGIAHRSKRVVGDPGAAIAPSRGKRPENSDELLASEVHDVADAMENPSVRFDGRTEEGTDAADGAAKFFSADRILRQISVFPAAHEISASTATESHSGKVPNASEESSPANAKKTPRKTSRHELPPEPAAIDHIMTLWPTTEWWIETAPVPVEGRPGN